MIERTKKWVVFARTESHHSEWVSKAICRIQSICALLPIWKCVRCGFRLRWNRKRFAKCDGGKRCGMEDRPQQITFAARSLFAVDHYYNRIMCLTVLYLASVWPWEWWIGFELNPAKPLNARFCDMFPLCKNSIFGSTKNHSSLKYSKTKTDFVRQNKELQFKENKKILSKQSISVSFIQNNLRNEIE